MITVTMPGFKEAADSMATNFPMPVDSFGVKQQFDHPPVNVVRQVKIDLLSRRPPLGPDEAYEANVPNYGKVELRGWGPRMWYRFTPAEAYRKRQNLPAVIEGHGMPGL